MQEIIRMNQTQGETETRGGGADKTPVAIILGILGGSLCALAGFLLLGIHSLTGANDRLEDFAGVSLLIVAFICFGVSSHFMDAADERRGRLKKERIENFKKNLRQN